MLQAIGKNIVVRPFKEEAKPSLILTTKEEKPKFWEVLSIGQEVKFVSPGDRVLLAQYGFHEVIDGDEKYFMCKEENIFAKKI